MQSLRMPRQPRARARAALAAALALIAVAAGALTAGAAQGAAIGKNVIFILTDDMTSSEVTGMPNVMSEIAGRGTTFNRAYVSFPLCCPSRATMMSGRDMHNHGVHGTSPPQGGWPKYRPQEESDLPVRLHGVGYHNVHIGK